ncbi:hypothetical protein [Vibrio fluvialis]|uniref:hypothetical protein n=1 Tax=Vibrio fluvialis TaxID=676 RepID=UPI003D7CAEB2
MPDLSAANYNAIHQLKVNEIAQLLSLNGEQVTKLDQIISLIGNSSSGSIPIDGVLALNNYKNKFEYDGATYLKSGFTESDMLLYPLAYTTGGNYSGFSFSVASQETSPSGVIFDGTYFWVVGYATGSVYQYDSTGVYTGLSFSVASQETNPQGIARSGDYIFVCGTSSNSIHKYDLSGTYTGESFPVQTSPRGMCTYNSGFLVISSNTVYKYDSSLSYTGQSFSVSSQGSTHLDVTYDGDFIWTIEAGATNKNIYKYTDDGFYTGVSITVNAEDTTPTGLSYYEGKMFITGDAGNTVDGYDLYIGIQDAKTDSDTGLPIYVRIG